MESLFLTAWNISKGWKRAQGSPSTHTVISFSSSQGFPNSHFGLFFHPHPSPLSEVTPIGSPAYHLHDTQKWICFKKICFKKMDQWLSGRIWSECMQTPKDPQWVRFDRELLWAPPPGSPLGIPFLKPQPVGLKHSIDKASVLVSPGVKSDCLGWILALLLTLYKLLNPSVPQFLHLPNRSTVPLS